MWGCFGLMLQTWKGNIYFTELAERVEYGNYVSASCYNISHYITLHYITLYYIILHHIILYYIILHYTYTYMYKITEFTFVRTVSRVRIRQARGERASRYYLYADVLSLLVVVVVIIIIIIVVVVTVTVVVVVVVLLLVL